MNNTPTAAPSASILAVDDSPESLRLLASVLAQQGYTVRAALGGRLALASAQADPPDLILLDVKMPEIDGYEVCTQLKADECTRDIPVIFISVATEVLDKVKAFSAGGVDYITKPFQAEEVLARVETHLALRRAQKQLEERNAQLEREITERRRAEDLIRAQRDLGLALSAARGLEETLRLCIEAAIRASGMDCGGVYLVDESSGNVDLAFHIGLPPDFVESASHYAADSANARLIMAGKAVYTRHQELEVPLDEARHYEGLRAVAVIPVSYEEQVIACLNVASHTLDEVPDFSRIALETIAAQIGSAIARSRTEEALQQSRANLQTLFDSLEDFLFVLDMEGRILDVNPVVLKRLGYSKTELLGEHVLKVHPADRHEEAAAIIADMVAGKTDVCPVPVISKDGTLIPVETKIAQGRWGGQEALFGTSRDITERMRAEEQLQRYTAELERSNEEVRQFAYVVSHDLRAPLVNLKGFAAELRSALEVAGSAMNVALPHLDGKQQGAVATALQEDIPEALGFIDSSVTRMDRFIKALLELSRLGRRQLQPEPIDMNALVQATLQTLAHQIEEQGVKVTVGSLPDVVADQTSMEQVIGNILDNAVKYLVPDRPGEIEVTGERGRDETTFRIRDNGRGITEEDMDKVFAPFRRLGRQDVPGEGMGLRYVQTLVRRHAGRIWCDSQPGVGTTFAFTVSNFLAQGGDHA